MPAIAAMHRTSFGTVERATDATDAPLQPSSAVSVEDFDYEDRFTPVALRIMPRTQGDDADLEVLAGT